MLCVLALIGAGCSGDAPDGLTPRLERYLERTYDEDSVEAVTQGLRDLAGVTGDLTLAESGRILAAAAVLGDGDLGQFRAAVELGRVDWRDLLVAADLGGADWQQALEDLLGPP